MSVLSCSRPGCDSIMCDTYVINIGYVCTDCKREFKLYLEKENIQPATKMKIEKELAKFMDTEKDYYSAEENPEMSVDEFFEKYDRTKQ